MQAEFISDAALFFRHDFGLYAVSVFLALDEPVPDLCRSQSDLSRYTKVRLSTVARVQGADFALLPSFQRPHYSIVLPTLADSTLARLVSCFDAPIKNPGWA